MECTFLRRDLFFDNGYTLKSPLHHPVIPHPLDLPFNIESNPGLALRSAWACSELEAIMPQGLSFAQHVYMQTKSFLVNHRSSL